MVTKTAATTFGDLSLSSSGFVVDVNGEHMQTYYQGQCFGAFQLSHRELTTEGIFFSLINGFSPETLGWASGCYLGICP